MRTLIQNLFVTVGLTPPARSQVKIASALSMALFLFLASGVRVSAQYTFTTLDLPGTAYGISGSNIVGTAGGMGPSYGFLYDGSSYTTIAVPGAEATAAHGISGSNIVGY